MEAVAYLDVLSAIAFAAAFFLVLTSSSPLLQSPSRFFLLASMAIYVFVGISNILEHGHVTSALDTLEDYAEILFIPFFLMFLYSFIVGRESRRRQASVRRLAESEGRYRTLVENIDLGITLIDSSHRIVMANAAQGKMFQRPPEEFVGRHCFREFEKRDSRCPHCPGVDAMAHREKREVETEGVRDDGSRFTVRVQAFPHFDSDGEVTGFLEVVEDITDRAERERDHARRRAEFEAIFQSIQDAVVFVDTDRRTVLVNPYFTKLFGYTTKDLKGKTTEVIYADPADYLDQGRSRYHVGAGDTKPTYEMRYRRKDGSEFDSETLGGAVKDQEGKVIGFIGVIRDISERKRMEHQLVEAQKMEAVGTMAGGVAHDFRNLLQVIHGFAELLLLDERTKASWGKEVAEIQQAADRGAELTSQLLTFSRRVDSLRRPVDLNALLVNIILLVERTIPRMISVEFRPGENMQAVMADPTQIEQVLLNLAYNARDSMERGGVLTISTEQVTLDEDYCRDHLEAAPGPYALLRVSDTGAGMDEETVEHIFEPFFTTKGVGKGTGLGLSTVYGIIKSHEGHISCDSGEGTGTTFTIYLPSIDLESTGEGEKERVQSRGGSETILLVDDDASVVNVARAFLDRLGYTVVIAGSGEEALERYGAKAGEVDLVILDLGMPGMGGEECLRELAARDPGVKVLVASGYASAGQGKKLKELGATGFITKPYGMGDLSEEVRRALDS
jgi:PAS domain S-box-containing protein